MSVLLDEVIPEPDSVPEISCPTPKGEEEEGEGKKEEEDEEEKLKYGNLFSSVFSIDLLNVVSNRRNHLY